MHLESLVASVKATVCYFDKVAFRTRYWPNKATEDLLRKHARSVDIRPGHPIRNSREHCLITLTVPKRRALEIAARLGWRPNYIEIAIDWLVRELADAAALHCFLDEHFVQGWHGKQELVRYSPLGADDPCATSYSGQRRASLRFAWYSHRLSKITDEPCLHLESRHRGAAACRRLGVHTAADLLDFDHLAHWQRFLNCYRIDFERLGRSDRNTRERTRRQKPDIRRRRKLGYNVDAANGQVLFRVLAAHEHQPMRSVQRFVDEYGRGAFLERVDVSGLLALLIDYTRETKLLRNILVSIEEFPTPTPTPRSLPDLGPSLDRDLPSPPYREQGPDPSLGSPEPLSFDGERGP